MKYIVILLSTILISSCGTVQTTGDILNNKSLSKLEKDIAICELGKPLYSKCAPYSGYVDYENSDNYNWDESYKDNWKNGNIYYSSEWVDECPSGEYKISLNLFGAETYIRPQDIKECMNEKGYSYKAQKWIKNRNGFVSFKGKWIKADTYLNNILTPKDESTPETNKPEWEVRVYPKVSCRKKYDFFYCNKRGTFYEGEGIFIKEMYYPKSIIDNLFQAGYTIKDIENHPLENNKKEMQYPAKTKIKHISQDKNTIENLKKAKDLFDSGVINKQEFKNMKSRIIERM